MTRRAVERVVRRVVGDVEEPGFAGLRLVQLGDARDRVVIKIVPPLVQASGVNIGAKPTLQRVGHRELRKRKHLRHHPHRIRHAIERELAREGQVPIGCQGHETVPIRP